MKLVLLLTLVNILNYLDRNLVQAVRPVLDAEWQLSQAESGFLVSAFVIGYAFFSPVAGVLAHRWHRPRLLALGVALWSVGTCATGLAPSQLLFTISRITVGIGESLFVTVAATYLRDLLIDPVRITRAFSLFYAAIPIGSALGYVVGGWVASRASWQMAFFVGGIPGFLCAPLLWRLPAVESEQQSERSTHHERRNHWQSLAEVFRYRSAIGIIAGYVANTFALAGIAANVASHGTSLGFSLEEIGTRFGITLVVSGLLGTVGGGWFAARIARNSVSRERIMMLFCAVTAAVACPLLFAALETSSKEWFIALCFVAELFIFAGTAPVNSLLVTVVPPSIVGATQGLSIAAINLLGSFLAPLLVGIVADAFSLRWGLHLCSSALALSGVLWWMTASRLTIPNVATSPVFGEGGALIRRRAAQDGSLHSSSSPTEITGMAASSPMENLAGEVIRGSVRAIARGITVVERGGEAARALLERVYPAGGHARVIGFTGPPGAGKSTLVDQVAMNLRRRGYRVAILAVDPTSPFTGGAILGDRIRMAAIVEDPSVFIRSMATRGALGGLARATFDAIAILDAAGVDIILLETVGVGQVEVDVVRMVDSCVVVVVPGMGDAVQAFKAGILEIGDMFVLNKADREGADLVARDMRLLLSLEERRAGAWEQPLERTIATNGEGVAGLVERLEEHGRFLAESGEGAIRRRNVVHGSILRVITDQVAREIVKQQGEMLTNAVERCVTREVDVYAAAQGVLQVWRGEKK